MVSNAICAEHVQSYDPIKEVMEQLKMSIQNAKAKINNSTNNRSRWIEIHKGWYIHNIDMNLPSTYINDIFSCHLVMANVGAELPVHIHEQNLKLIMLEGELCETETGHIIKKDEVLEVPSGKKHGFTVTKPTFSLVIFIPPLKGELHAI